MDSQRGDIELDALRALAGAEEVRKKVLAFVAMGNPSVDTLAYLIKCRIKNHERLVDKVIERRKRKPDYQATDATDIVGLRILALYRAELPIIIRHFMALVRFASEDPINLFVGPDLQHSLNEVIIYRASPEGDVVDQLITAEFERIGLTCAVVPDKMPPQNVQADVKIIRKATEYSSIHLVFWCYGFTKDKKYRVPLEVQIRTVIEDVWGEIDHALNYKVETGDPARLDDTQKQHFRSATDGLKILKRLLDNCTQQADLIHSQIENIFGGSSHERKPSPAARSVDTQKLLDLDIDLNIRDALSKTVAIVRDCFDRIYRDEWPATPEDVPLAIKQFAKAATLLETHFQDYQTSPSPDPAIDRDVHYYLPMERCLCLYWVAYLIKAIMADRADDALKKQGDQALETSLREYFQIERDPRFKDNPILPFRVGNALRLRGYTEIAYDKFKEAYLKLAATKLEAEHSMKMRIPRAHSMMLWEQGEMLRRNAVKLNNPELALAARQNFYLQALDVALASNGASGKLQATDDHEKSDDNEARISINNTVEYTLSYLRSGGTWLELEQRGMTRERLRSNVDRLIGKGLDTIRLPTLADTIRSAAHYFDDPDLVANAARRVLELIDRPNLSAGLSEESFAEMRTDAEADLMGGGVVVKSARPPLADGST